MEDNEFITTNFEDECSSNDEDLDDDIWMSYTSTFYKQIFFRFGETIENILLFCALCSL